MTVMYYTKAVPGFFKKQTVCFTIGFVKATISPQCLYVFGHHTVRVVVLQLAPPLLKPCGDDRQGIDS
jgi:hypothetical protein